MTIHSKTLFNLIKIKIINNYLYNDLKIDFYFCNIPTALTLTLILIFVNYLAKLYYLKKN